MFRFETGQGRRYVLRGRDHERAVITGLLDAARVGHSGALVLLGEAGMGKTSLLDLAVTPATGLHVARVAGVEAERELPFAALHQLCGPLLGHLARLPEPQRDALRTTFGMRSDPAPEPFLVGLAVLTLLAEAAAERPLICVIDDAQWLDHASARTLAFVARRLGAESVVMLFAARRPADRADDGVLAGLPELHLSGLADADARALLDAVVRWPLDADVREAVLAEARGNPLALRELPHDRSPVKLAGGFGLPHGRIEESYLRRIDGLPADARLLLLLAAADPVGDPGLLRRAAALLGVGAEAGDPLHAEGLVRIGARVVFRHSLVRSAVYGAASTADRRRVHQALAEATSPAADPDRRAWHRAHGTAGTDEQVAQELEASAGRAQARGGLAAAAAFLVRAAELTADPTRRADRELAAARATYRAGSPDAAAALLAGAEAIDPGPLRGAWISLLRAEMAFTSAAAPAMLLEAARRLETIDVTQARRAYLEAFAAAVFMGRFAGTTGLSEVAAAARTAPPSPAPTPADLLLDALAVLYTEGFAAGTAPVRQALAELRRHPADQETVHFFYVVAHAAHTVWDDDAWQELTSRHLRAARTTGALSGITFILYQRLALHLHQGEIRQAAALVDEVDAVGAALGDPQPAIAALAVAAWRGDESEVNRLLPAVTGTLTSLSQGAVLTAMHLFVAVLANGSGRYAQGRAAAELATAYPKEMGFANWALVELVEAAARCGDRDAAEQALERLTGRTRASASDWGLGVQARSRALVTEGTEAEDLHREAIERLARSGAAFDLARAHLLYGEWLRRSGRTSEARTALRRAHDMFVSSGAEAFAERAGRELAATGAPAGARVAAAPTELTAQERQIARRARDGQSNAEIGAELFLSGRTVEWHLRKVFTKLGISNRRELRTALTS
ncbi:helix-turn-helix transcriptional regulator [Actinoplanes sp. OR16]|uniref:AAA family ATPase n=1 Tax=Actinoplanes sp. OR16 TaxID=946334 RepID=UPI000F6C3731|nr:AAA family ATPase [Actinoplanes sp. OR16]BBH69113.1 helix-turn-helix transcriptional regulator [Actinoplanes sp. OR16]